MENNSLILQELALEVRSTVATLYDKSWDRDIYNIWVDRHNKCLNCMGEYFENNVIVTLYFGVFTSKCSIAVKGCNVKSLLNALCTL